MRVEILGQERRRRWGDEKKLDIVMSVGLDGATVTEVAHRHDVTRQQIYAWRHELKKKGLLPSTADTVFLPVDTSAMHGAPLVREDVARVPAKPRVAKKCQWPTSRRSKGRPADLKTVFRPRTENAKAACPPRALRLSPA
jgi:transposase